MLDQIFDKLRRRRIPLSRELPPARSGVAPADKRVCVIGAGPSGLAMVKSLHEAGVRQVVAFEQSEGLGGLWRLQPPPGHSSVYDSTELKSSKEVSGFSDFPFPAAFPSYPNHREVVRYLEAYAARFQLNEALCFGARVEQVQPSRERPGCWDVHIRHLDDDRLEQRCFDAVVVGNGHLWHPKLPTFDGQDRFEGRIEHSHDYRRPERYANEHVVVLGAGNSAADIAPEVSDHAAATWLSVRTPELIYERFLLGRPLDHLFMTRLHHALPWLSLLPMRDAARNAGGMARLGLPWKLTAKQTHGVSTARLLDLLLNKRIRARPNIARLHRRTVEFADGSRVRADTILCCTGYLMRHPFLPGGLLRVHDNEIDLYRHIFPPDHPGLYFLGICQVQGPNIPVIELQARWVARVIAECCGLPSTQQMRREIQATREQTRATWGIHPDSTQYANETPYIAYCDQLADEIGARPRLRTMLKLLGPLFLAPMHTACYRLEGPGAWPGAAAHLRQMYRHVRAGPVSEPVPNALVRAAERAEQEAEAARHQAAAAQPAEPPIERGAQ